MLFGHCAVVVLNVAKSAARLNEGLIALAFHRVVQLQSRRGGFVLTEGHSGLDGRQIFRSSE